MVYPVISASGHHISNRLGSIILLCNIQYLGSVSPGHCDKFEQLQRELVQAHSKQFRIFHNKLGILVPMGKKMVHGAQKEVSTMFLFVQLFLFTEQFCNCSFQVSVMALKAANLSKMSCKDVHLHGSSCYSAIRTRKHPCFSMY